MKRSAVTARRARAAALASAAALTVGLAGCSTQSPVTVQTPYQAADGTNASIPGSGIKLSNFLVVSSGKGQPGQVVGSVINQSAKSVTVTMQTDLGETGQPTQTAIRVPAHGVTQVGPSGTPLTISDTPQPPGALMTISANYQASGGISLSVPVVPPTGYYSSYTVAPTTPAPSPTGTPSASTAPGPESSAEPTTEPTNS